MAKHKVNDPEQDRYLTNQLLKTINETPALKGPDPDWNLQGSLPTDCEIRFLSSEYGARFAPWDEFSCKTIKLINPHKPACRLTFFQTHRYWLKKAKDITAADKKETIESVRRKLQERLDELTTRLPIDLLKAADNKEKEKNLLAQLTQWQEIAHQPDQFHIALSNYHRYYFYNTLNFKYLIRDKGSELLLANETVHLLKNQYDKTPNKSSRQATQIRYNVIFIDLQSITQPDPYQNKEIDSYLALFPIQTDMYTYHAYVRPIIDDQPDLLAIADTSLTLTKTKKNAKKQV